MKRKLTTEQKFHELKKYCEDRGLHLMGENVRLGTGVSARFLFQHPSQRGKGQFVVLHDTFDGDVTFDEKMKELEEHIDERYDTR